MVWYNVPPLIVSEICKWEMSMNLIEKIPLPNGLVMEVWDRSRAIATDTTKVELLITVPVTMEQAYFSDPEHFRRVVEIFGPEIAYEYTKERTFVSTADSRQVFTDLLDDFRRDSLPYLSKDDFPRRFALSKLSEIHRHPHRYRKAGTASSHN